MTETDLTLSAPTGPVRELETNLRRARLALGEEQEARLGEIGKFARLVAHEIFRSDTREHQRREALRDPAPQAVQDCGGLLDQPLGGAFVLAADMAVDVHAALPDVPSK